MSFEEQKALKRAHKMWNGVLFTVGLVGVIALVIVLLGGVAGYPGNVQHIMGQSTKATATVTNIQKVDFCTRRNRDQYTLTWQEDGMSRTETVGRCGDPWDVGDKLTVWSTEAEPYTESPWVMRSMIVLLTTALGVTGWLAWRGRKKIKKAAESALNGTWQPQVYSTIGLPGARNFRMNPPRPNRNRVSDWIRVLYKPEGEYQIPLDVPGTLYIDGFQGDRPSGLSLHETADGRRVWRWHGRIREQKLR